jgi:hypothetical protein
LSSFATSKPRFVCEFRRFGLPPLVLDFPHKQALPYTQSLIVTYVLKFSRNSSGDVFALASPLSGHQPCEETIKDNEHYMMKKNWSKKGELALSYVASPLDGK